MTTRLAATQLFGFALAAFVVVVGGLLFITTYTQAAHSGAMIQAAKLGRLERQDSPWVLGAVIVLMAAYVLILGASAYGRRQVISGTWRWSITAAAIVLALAPGAAYPLLAGGAASYASAQDYGVVSRDGIVHYPWGQAVSAEVACEPQQVLRAVVRFKVAFADGRHDQFSFILQRGDPSPMIDWDLWLAYQIHRAHRDLPDIRPNPTCDALVYAVAPPDFQAKYRQLFAPGA